jgi:hypothetical protein
MKRQANNIKHLLACTALVLALSGAALGAGARAEAVRIKPASFTAAHRCDAHHRYFAHYYTGYMSRECFYYQRAHSTDYHSHMH